MTYRKTIATALIALALTACKTDQQYASVCHTPTEDSRVTCQLNPTARYEYDQGAWRQVEDSYRHANGNQPPTGAEVMAFDPSDDG